MKLVIYDTEKEKEFVLKDLVSFQIEENFIICEFEFGTYNKEFNSKKYNIHLEVEN